MTEMLNEADITAQLESEIQALNGGINPSDEYTQEEDSFEETQEEVTQEEDYQEDDTEDWEDKEPKTEKKIKKLLSQRNTERKEKENLAERLTKMENQLADTDFYKDNQDAIQHKDKINDLVNERWFTRDEAYLLIAWKAILEQNKKLNSNKTTHIWNTPWVNKNWTNPNNMNMADLDSLVNNMYSAGKLKI